MNAEFTSSVLTPERIDPLIIVRYLTTPGLIPPKFVTEVRPGTGAGHPHDHAGHGADTARSRA